ncbi:MAG: cell division protein FtsA [Prolixibacteraceae bacterium]|nr:cell division protein FtsA [Prolixibacteraceae bacterium]
MSERNIVAAVDIGTNTVICLVGSKDEREKIDIIGHSIVASSGVRRGGVFNIEEVVVSVRNAVEKATRDLDFNINKLYVNVAGQNLRTVEKRLSKHIGEGKIISNADVRELFRTAKEFNPGNGDKVYHVINQSYSVDGETGIHNPIGVPGVELVAEYRLVIGPENYEQLLRASLEKAGFNLVRCIVNPIAAADAVVSADEKEAGVVVVDLGAGTTSISIYYDSVLRHLGMIPFGGNVVTRDIREGCSIVLRQAESLKVQYGAAMGENISENMVVTIPGKNGWEPKEISFKSLAYIIQARMEEIIESIYFQIEKSGFIEHLGAGIVITGGGAKLEYLANLVKFKTGMDVRVGLPVNGIVNEKDKPVITPQYATAFGLLKKAINDETANNDEVIVKRPRRNLFKQQSESIMQRLTLFFNDEQDSEL